VPFAMEICVGIFGLKGMIGYLTMRISKLPNANLIWISIDQRVVERRYENIAM
jgi:hypothetical protein